MEEMKKRLEISRRERKDRNKDKNVQENLCIVCSENPKEVNDYLHEKYTQNTEFNLTFF